MEDILDLIADLLPAGWELEDGYGLDFNLICPHGDMIEQDGACPAGCVSPLRALGLI